MDKATTKKKTRKQLELEIKTLEAQLSSSYHFADAYIKKLTRERLMASGILVQITYLNGKEAVTPFVAKDGFSDETITALRKELKYSFDRSVEFGL